MIVKLTNSTNKIEAFYTFPNKDWPWERLVEEYEKQQSEKFAFWEWRGEWYDFIRFIEQRGAVKIEITSLDIPSYPDPKY